MYQFQVQLVQSVPTLRKVPKAHCKITNHLIQIQRNTFPYHEFHTSHILSLAAMLSILCPLTMSTISSYASLTTVSNDLLAKWPALHANLYVKCDHNPDLGVFWSIPLKDLCLAGLGLTTCDLHLSLDRTSDNIHILCTAYVTYPLDISRWINIPNAGLVHLTCTLPLIDHNVQMFQGWPSIWWCNSTGPTLCPVLSLFPADSLLQSHLQQCNRKAFLPYSGGQFNSFCKSFTHNKV